MGKPTHTPNVRLAVAGFASLILLVALATGKSTRDYGLFAGIVFTLVISMPFVIVVILAPVIWLGPPRERLLALLLTLFPLSLLAMALLEMFQNVRIN